MFVTNLIDDLPVPVYGDGRQIRDWLHVDDHARGILHVLEHGELGEVYNIGGGNIARTSKSPGRSWKRPDVAGKPMFGTFAIEKARSALRARLIQGRAV